jgi:hypothetical protein
MRKAGFLSALLLWLAMPLRLLAQGWIEDSAVARLSWGTVNVLVRADSVGGLQVWAHTSPLAYSGAPLAFFAAFDPDSVMRWLDRAHRIVTYRTPPDSVQLALQTPPVSGRNGGQIVLLRNRTKKNWEKRITVMLLDSHGRHPWAIKAKLPEAEQFLQALFDQTQRSRLHPDSVLPLEANPLEPESCPWPLPGNPIPSYPAGLEFFGKSGEVWLLFVVQADGTADPTSFRAIMSDHPRFTAAAVDALRGSRYTPGRVSGQPVPMLVSQRIVFRMK